jgi:hypothetical protein
VDDYLSWIYHDQIHQECKLLAHLSLVSQLVKKTLKPANLDQLAKNNALEMQGNTIVKLDSSEFGRRDFSIYQCKI